MLFVPTFNAVSNPLAPRYPSTLPVVSIVFKLPPDQIFPPMPRPPLVTFNAPVIVLVACVGSLIVNALLIVPPEKLLMLAAVTTGLPFTHAAVATRK